jgi:hypothetical protein
MIEEYVHSEEARDDHCIREPEKYMGSAKVNCYCVL